MVTPTESMTSRPGPTLWAGSSPSPLLSSSLLSPPSRFIMRRELSVMWVLSCFALFATNLFPLVQRIQKLIQPTYDWGPASPQHRRLPTTSDSRLGGYNGPSQGSNIALLTNTSSSNIKGKRWVNKYIYPWLQRQNSCFYRHQGYKFLPTWTFKRRLWGRHKFWGRWFEYEGYQRGGQSKQ